jgi:hypothetical protein
MGKVSIGLHGWRFDESELFGDDDEWRSLEAMSPDTRKRLLRLQTVIGKPCDACYLVHGEANKEACNVAEVVYGEPMDEVVLCSDHETDFLFWFRERGGRSLAGQETFRDAFHEWFDDDGRAPAGYEGIEHVAAEPEALPEPPAPEDVYDREAELLDDIRPEFEGEGVKKVGDRGDEDAADADTTGETADDTGEESGDAGDDPDVDDLDVDDLDLDREYPGS